MKWFLRIVLAIIFTLGVCLWFLPKKFAEHYLQDYFGMRVSIGDVFYNPRNHDLTLKNLQLSNQEGFSSRDHLRVEELKAKINFKKMMEEKHVEIQHLDLKEPYFLIERVLKGEEGVTNITTWIRFLKEKIRINSESKAKTLEVVPSQKWRVTIREIQVGDGVFEYDGLGDNDYYFSHIFGVMKGFDWPTEDPQKLTQHLILKGEFGRKKKAPFKIEGDANFATKRLHFDLKANTEEGDLIEYERFLKNFPIVFLEGRFNLKIWMKCENGNIDTQTELKLDKLRIKPEEKIKDRVLGLPVVSAMKFLETEKNIVLNVPVSGKLKDPNFKFEKAFREAFQEALTSRTLAGAKVIVKAPISLAGVASEQMGKATMTVEKATKHIEGTASEAVSLLESVALQVIPGGKKNE